MRRVMVVGGSGAGKTTLALELGRRTGLPVRHMDRIHYEPGWVQRPKREKDRLTREVHTEDAWIFEGGHSRTYDERAKRADTLIWLDLPVGLRLARVLNRWWRLRGQSRPDLTENCPERLDPELFRWIVATRRRARRRIVRVIAGHPHLRVHHLRSTRDVRRFLASLPRPSQ